MGHRSFALGVCLGIVASLPAHGNPVGPQVSHGQVSFSQPTPNTLNITNSPNAIINWRGFSIQRHEITRFIQQSAGS
ncbi:MAG: hypothetical protein GY731_12700, partial [Gammaproteobacteria bacterium]|nr:hypothetical protein [Gammaproteobacteria bacterium]